MATIPVPSDFGAQENNVIVSLLAMKCWEGCDHLSSLKPAFPLFLSALTLLSLESLQGTGKGPPRAHATPGPTSWQLAAWG